MPAAPNIPAKERLIVALDFPNVEEARALTTKLGDTVIFYKIGLELVYAGGLALVDELKAQGKKIFLDAKLLDIGHTVEKATASISRLNVDLLTIHGTDLKTMQAAVRGKAGSPLKIMAVTVMTNLDEADLKQQGIEGKTPGQLVLLRAELAQQAGCDGVISSGHEAAKIRAQSGEDFYIITPGIRMASDDAGDQSRVMTPQKAIASGASHLVVGRPITQSDDPVQAAMDIIEQIRQAL